MSDYKWISLRHLFDESILTTQPGVQNMFSKHGLGIEYFHKHVDHVEWPSIQLGFKKNLYGLSLYMLGFLLNRLIPQITKLYLKIATQEENLVKKLG